MDEREHYRSQAAWRGDPWATAAVWGIGVMGAGFLLVAFAWLLGSLS